MWVGRYTQSKQPEAQQLMEYFKLASEVQSAANAHCTRLCAARASLACRKMLLSIRFVFTDRYRALYSKENGKDVAQRGYTGEMCWVRYTQSKQQWRSSSWIASSSQAKSSLQPTRTTLGSVRPGRHWRAVRRCCCLADEGSQQASG